MKLISFVVISLLAITVSAQPPPSTSAANHAPQSEQEKPDAKLVELRAKYERLQSELALKLEELEKVEKEEKVAMSVVKSLSKKLEKSSLDSEDQEKVGEKYPDALGIWREAYTSGTIQKKELKKATKKSDSLKKKTSKLTGNQEQQTKQDADSNDPTEPSPDSATTEQSWRRKLMRPFRMLTH
ncbi:hypothetical protein BASA50_007468 [Batrachochytrium salamandrivorans]|uniref:Uncharacterized protein n=1 Tax=Batrachochytrium salamandrivorans TaxID=1357716 RepID=A0ABQ8FA39_9FUNG|nr:hypothetical protein BASA60_009206 [Batrachochytrium salamandrivorans]KAH6593262.1 hypothetical protein BASA50_007468 [Batrachochytrium salamandrivorans]KAH9247746.1 hypothetical protein BASA81_014635 [Batrachochytrium salamandrivorans]KAH9274162.1 hypothetical protein BASA83_003466 [Batrachochytrium salamandrivorans]